MLWITLHSAHQILVELHGRAKRASKLTSVPAPNFGEYAKQLYRDNVARSDDPIHTEGALLVHVACEQAKKFRADVTSAAAAQRRYGRWSPREAKKLARAVMAIVHLSEVLRKEDVLGKLSGDGRLPPPDWRS